MLAAHQGGRGLANVLRVLLQQVVLLGTVASVVVISNSDNVKTKMKKQKVEREKAALKAKLEQAGVEKKSARAERAKVKRAKEDAGKGLLAKALEFVQSPVIKYGLLYVLWIVAGIFYGIHVEDWTTTKSLLFSVAATSTAGLVAPTTGDTAMALTMWYTLIGVFLFAMLFGHLGDFVLQHIQKRVCDERAGLSAGAQERLKQNMVKHKTKIDYQTFFEFSIVAEGMVTEDNIKVIEAAWDTMNADKNDCISLDELYCAQVRGRHSSHMRS